MKHMIVLAVLIFTALFLYACGSGEKTEISEKDKIKVVAQAYLDAKKSYNIEKQLDLLSKYDREELGIDYVVLKNAQPSALTKMLVSRYGKWETKEVGYIQGQDKALVQSVIENPDFIKIGRKFRSLNPVTLLEIRSEVTIELQQTSAKEPKEMDILQKMLKKIYHGSDWPKKVSKKRSLLTKEKGVWKIELNKGHWDKL